MMNARVLFGRKAIKDAQNAYLMNSYHYISRRELTESNLEKIETVQVGTGERYLVECSARNVVWVPLMLIHVYQA